jgi:azurin
MAHFSRRLLIREMPFWFACCETAHHFSAPMNLRILILSLTAALIATGCQKDTTSTATGSTAAAPPTSAAPATTPAAAKAAPRVIAITGNDQMKFSVTNIEVKVGEEIKVVFTNAGMLPKEAMGHNWVLLTPGSDVNAFAATAMTARDKDYIPDSLKEQIVVYTKMLGPKQSDEVVFTINAPGEYPFLCSFPAHAMAGMKGVLVAK